MHSLEAHFSGLHPCGSQVHPFAYYFNSKPLDYTKKFRNFRGFGFAIWKISDRLCVEMGYPLLKCQSRAVTVMVLGLEMKNSQHLGEAGRRFDLLSDKINAREKGLSEITSLQKHISTYRKTRDIYVQ